MLKAIQNRQSTRNFENKPFTDDVQNKVDIILKNLSMQRGLFQNKFNLFYAPRVIYNQDTRTIIGTYGFIKHPSGFVGASIPNTKEALIDFGYLLEKTVLQLEEIGVGSVWLGGSFERNKLNHFQQDNELLPAVIAIGYPKKGRHIIEYVIRGIARPDKRLSFHSLFQQQDGTEITEDHPFYTILKAVQIAPSASNKQPWRIVVENNKLHLYLERTPNYAKMLSYDIQMIDMGIALAHLVLQAEHEGYTWKMLKSDGEPEHHIATIEIHK